MARLNDEQNRAVDIIQRMKDKGFYFVDLFVLLVFNFDVVEDYILENYDGVLEDE